jgi:hypothetical protein
MLVRIYTEDKERERLKGLVSQHFSGFTLVSVTGVYKNQEESSIIVEIVVEKFEESVKTKVTILCKEINKMNNQECCLVQTIPNQFHYIS